MDRTFALQLNHPTKFALYGIAAVGLLVLVVLRPVLWADDGWLRVALVIYALSNLAYLSLDMIGMRPGFQRNPQRELVVVMIAIYAAVIGYTLSAPATGGWLWVWIVLGAGLGVGAGTYLSAPPQDVPDDMIPRTKPTELWNAEAPERPGTLQRVYPACAGLGAFVLLALGHTYGGDFAGEAIFLYLAAAFGLPLPLFHRLRSDVERRPRFLLGLLRVVSAVVVLILWSATAF